MISLVESILGFNTKAIASRTGYSVRRTRALVRLLCVEGEDFTLRWKASRTHGGSRFSGKTNEIRMTEEQLGRFVARVEKYKAGSVRKQGRRRGPHS